MNYQQQSLAGFNGVELIIALYDGMVRFLYRAIEAIDAGDVARRRRAIKRVFDILIHLQARLANGCRRFPGQGAERLLHRDVRAGAAGFAGAVAGDKLLQAIACIRNVREAWQQVALIRRRKR
jgi:flagellar protein FliS